MTQVFLLTMTSEAPPMVLISARVLFVVRMSLRTMSLATITFSAKAAALVLGIVNYLKVCRVNAMSHATKMVKLHPFRNWTDQPLVTQPMSLLDFVSRKLEMAIPINNGCGPQPAGIRFLNLSPKTNLWRNRMITIRHGNYIVTTDYSKSNRCTTNRNRGVL